MVQEGLAPRRSEARQRQMIGYQLHRYSVMVTGTMTESPNWIVWLLVGLAILPMAIPVYRRYQVVRLRLTAPRVRGLMNIVPARLPFSRSLYLTPKGMTALHPERSGKSRIRFGLITSTLIAFPLLTVLTGIVYHRIAIETFNPPYFFDIGETGRSVASRGIHNIAVAQILDNR
jgi:hypothetical protein